VTAWPLDARAFSERVGAASSVKMCRSIMVKGIEALTVECAMAAHRYGVLPDVLGSLADMFPGMDWNEKARYLISRALVHGRRRAEEMRESMKTIADAGLDPVMTRSTAAKQDWAADLGAAPGVARAASADLDALLAALDHACGGVSHRKKGASGRS
jgi:3-hydroxyisobutyrate dehydrogenase